MSVVPLTMGASGPIIDRNKRDIRTPGQWLRELKENAEEAGAERIHFGIEWQGAENLGVYRRYAADDGGGMDERELDEFMRTYGGGGKPIGAEHENFGIGAKVTLLPWNREGVIVISYKDGIASMIRLAYDADENEYGAYVWTVLDGFGGEEQAVVISPEGFGIPEWGVVDFGAIWKQVPFWEDRSEPPEHGTLVLLIGNDPLEDTILGDPERPEERTVQFPAAYLNTRIWRVPEGMTITVDGPVSPERTKWPRQQPEEIELLGKSGITRRPVRGAYHYIQNVGGKVVASSETEGEEPRNIGSHVQIHWYLRETSGRPNPYGPRDGMIAVLYDDELYDISREPYRFRQFGIPWKEVQIDSFIVVEPPHSDGKEKHGVYPLGGRDALNLYGGKPLPFGDWGMAFAQNLPDAIKQRLKEVRPSDDGMDRSWKDRFAERYLERWRQLRFRLHGAGEKKINPAQRSPQVLVDGDGDGSDIKLPHRPRNTQSTLVSRPTTADKPTTGRSARKVEMASAIPDWIPAHAEDMDKPYLVAAFDATRENPDGSRGAVLLNVEHEAVKQFVTEFQSKYPPQVAEKVEIECLNVLGQSLVAKVVHAQSLSAYVPREEVEAKFLSSTALTTAALGMAFESEGLSTRIGGALGVRKVL
ncbi:MAG: ATP-binding protein [Actinomycetota bacterium]|nr:ATP-binding protein [Actinomycetota bacterium]